jgi:hypothetical protein
VQPARGQMAAAAGSAGPDPDNDEALREILRPGFNDRLVQKCLQNLGVAQKQVLAANLRRLQNGACLRIGTACSGVPTVLSPAFRIIISFIGVFACHIYRSACSLLVLCFLRLTARPHHMDCKRLLNFSCLFCCVLRRTCHGSYSANDFKRLRRM